MEVRKIRTAIVDDHKMLLGALSQWITNTAQDIEIVITAADWQELISNESFPPDVVLLDLDLKDNLSLNMKLATLKAAGCKIVIMSTYSEPKLVREALSNGAIGYLTKSEDATMIVEAIRSAWRNHEFISDELADEKLNSAEQIPRLSAQEQRVVQLYVSGSKVKEVAKELELSDETVKVYLRRVREKYRALGIDVRDKLSLRKRAIRDGYVIDFE